MVSLAPPADVPDRPGASHRSVSGAYWRVGLLGALGSDQGEADAGLSTAGRGSTSLPRRTPTCQPSLGRPG